MRTAAVLGLVVAVTLLAPPLRADEGQGTADPGASIERLKGAIVDYRDRMLSRAGELLASTPSETLPLLKDLAKELKGTSIAEPVDLRVRDLATSKELKAALLVEKRLAKIARGLEKRPPCKSCKRKGHAGMDPACDACRDASKSAVKKALTKLDALIEGSQALPIVAAVRRYADSWR